MARGLLVDVEGLRGLLVRALCTTGPCYLVFTSVEGNPIVAVVPAQPSPFCIQARRALAEKVATLLEAGLGGTNSYKMPTCIVSRTAVKSTVSETIEELTRLGIIREVLPPVHRTGRPLSGPTQV